MSCFEPYMRLNDFFICFLQFTFMTSKPECTYATYGQLYIKQPFYFCKTCGLVDTAGCCEACAKICHKGHDLVLCDCETSFCDCGAGDGKTPCQCMPKEDPSAPSQCTFSKFGKSYIK